MTDRVKLTVKISKQVRSLRTAMGISQYVLADLAGLTRPKIKRIEKREIQSVSTRDLDKILGALSKPPRKSGTRAANGRPAKKKRSTSTSGRTKVSVEPPGPELDETMRAEVSRRLEESVLEVMRDLIGETGRVLVEKHKLHQVTLGHLFQTPS